jgi:class 3 adenylate cyclase/predicted ATPase
MQQVADWLEKLGLGQYAQRFAENDISFVILPDLTDQDLEKIGVASLGHRRLLLRAITELKIVDKVTPLPDSAASAPSASAKMDAAERRQVTVMFTDLVGSTALSARMDPEDLREIIAAYQKCVAETVQHFGGFVAKYMGDGVLVYFGYPRAHEDDAERAVRAGLELIVAVSGLKTRAALRTRVGIATGLLVIGDLIGSGGSQEGDLIGSGGSQEQAIAGETPNLATRLQGIAEPDWVVIAESTRKLLGNLFELEELATDDLKGITSSVRAWAALRVASVESRFEALHASGLTELVGREEELELLLRRWSKAKTGEGQVVLLSGEAGIGKSRLTAELLERLASEPHTRLRYFCSPQHTDSAFYTIISQMQRAAALTHDDTAQAKLDKLDALLAQTSTSKQDAVLFADMLSLRNDGRYPTLELDPQQRRQRTIVALTVQVEALSRQKPVLMIFEDAHWADPTSLEAFSRAVDRIETLSVLLIVTHRPEFEPPWIGRPHVTARTLNRLGERDIAAMIDGVTGNKLLPSNIRQDIIERTDGIPLFVEEMTKSVLEAEGEEAAERAVAGIPSPFFAVPASLHASLMTRLDRLGPAKEVSQVGAAIGREFSHTLMEAVAGKPREELASALDRLVAAGLLFRQGVPPQATYLFKHALVQDAAYGTLLREPRRALHARIAETMEGQFAEIAENQPELLARHCTEAGLIEKAALLWGKAGQRSLARSALVEAVAQFTHALNQIATLPAAPALRREQIRFQVALINPLMHAKGFAAPETKAAVERARLLIEEAKALGEPTEDPLLLFSVLYSFWVANYIAFNGDVMRELATQFLGLAENQGAAAPLMIGHRIMGTSLLITGNIAESRAHLDRGLTLYHPARHRPLATRFGQDVGVTIQCYRSWALWLDGHPETALAAARHALEQAREIGHAITLIYALWHVSLPHIWCGNYQTAKTILDELDALAGQKSALFWKALGIAVTQGCLLVLSGKPTEAVQTIISGLTLYQSTGSTVFVPFSLSYLASAHASLGKFDSAWRCMGEAMTAVETTKERFWEAEINRIAGGIALSEPTAEVAKAEAYFERALAVARTQQAKSWELRAAMSMARLWRDQGKRDEARKLLAPVYGWFTEGFDTLDLKEAKSLLGKLSA